MTLDIKPLAGALGAEIRGVDLGRPLSDGDFAAVKSAWLDYQVIIFPGQDLDEEAQLRFARQFGELQEVRSAPGLGGKGIPVMHVANREVGGEPGILPDGEMQFHVDQCYYENPCRATILCAIEIPKRGGHTLFISATRAFDALAADLKSEIDSLQIFNIYDYGNNPTKKGDENSADAPSFIHPAVVVHPETGKRVLYVNRLMSDHFVGMERGESDRLLDRLLAHAEQKAFIYEHVWRVGDLVMWDNRAVMHGRTDFDPAEARIMRRAAVRGERPQGIGAAD